MHTVEQLQAHIGSVTELRSIVGTMKALSAASIRQYERAVSALADYHHTVELGLQVVLSSTVTAANHRPEQRPRRLAAAVFGSDHGLCGRFNDDIAAHALEHMSARDPDATTRTVLAVGARAAARLEQAGQPIEEDFLVPGAASRITATVQQILSKIDEWRTQGGVDEVYLYYNRHADGGGYRPTAMRLFPVDLNLLRRPDRRWPSRRLPSFTMDREQLLAALLRQYFFVSLFRACAESQASEHTSRLAAMQSAEKNLDERLEEVTAMYRRVRQDAITAELLDVIAGFEAASGPSAR